MLPSPNSLASAILALSPTTNSNTGMSNLVGAIENFMNQVQGGPTGTVGIFTLTTAPIISALAALPPVADNSWINGFADAMEAGINASVITPATVTNGAWLGSGSKDTLTLPSAAVTITTIAAAKATLISGLAAATASNNPPHPLAQAISDATLQFIFTCIGVAPAFEVPIPIPIPAE